MSSASAGAQGAPDPVERVPGAAAVPEGVLLDALATQVELGPGQRDDVERVHHGDRVRDGGGGPAVDRRPVGPRARPPVHDAAVSHADARRRDRRGPRPSPPQSSTPLRRPVACPTPVADGAGRVSARVAGRAVRWAELVSAPAVGMAARPGGHRPLPPRCRSARTCTAVAAVPRPRFGADLAGDGTDPRGAAGRLLTAPFTVESDRAARARRRLGLARLLDWLADAARRHVAAAVAGQRRRRDGQRASGGARCWPGCGHGTPRVRGVHVEQPAGLRADARLRRRDPPEPGLGADPARAAEPGRVDGPSSGPARFRRAGSVVRRVPGRDGR